MASTEGTATHLEAHQNNILSSYCHISVALRGTEIEDGVQCQFKLWTCPNERATNWLHLNEGVVITKTSAAT